MKKLFIIPAAAAALVFSAAGRPALRPLPAADLPAYTDLAEAIRIRGLDGEGAFAVLDRLIRAAPRRLTGSAGFAAAQEFMRREMNALGMETWLEPVPVEHWERGTVEEAAVLGGASGEWPLRVAALGLSGPTPESGLTAPVVEVRTFEELRAAAGRVKNAVVFFNHRMDPSRQDTFAAYGEAAAYRTRGAAEAAKLGAAAVLVRSLTLRLDGAPHAGVTDYDPAGPRIPAAAVATLDAEELSRRLGREPDLKIRLRFDCRTLPPVESANLVGQVRGTERPNEVIVLGAHLDAWDLGCGAHDDGAGCAQCLEAVRLLGLVGLRPKRTIRVVLYPNEEFGASAGRDYAQSPKRNGEKTLAAIESDRGGFLPLGLALGEGRVFESLRRWADLFRPAGIQWFRPGGGGADVGPLGAGGAALLNFIPDNQRYFDVHHSANDVLSSVHPRELELGAIATAILAAILAEEGI